MVAELLSHIEWSSAGYYVWREGSRPKTIPKDRLIAKAGTSPTGGYNSICFKRTNFYVHRIRWFEIYGHHVEFIDHIDGDKTNNAIENLRETSMKENGANRVEHRRGKLIGTTKAKDCSKWVAQIWHNKQKVYLGLYDTQELAHEAYIKYKKKVKQ